MKKTENLLVFCESALFKDKQNVSSKVDTKLLILNVIQTHLVVSVSRRRGSQCSAGSDTWSGLGCHTPGPWPQRSPGTCPAPEAVAPWIG